MFVGGSHKHVRALSTTPRCPLHTPLFFDVRRIPFIGPLFAMILQVPSANVYLFLSGLRRGFSLVATFLSMSLCGKTVH